MAKLATSIAFIGPALVINAAVILIPSILTLALAFFEWDGLGPLRFVGIRNFRNVVTDREVVRALVNNLIWTAIFVTIPVAMGLLGSELMRKTGGRFFLPVYFMPTVLPVVVVCVIWMYIYHPNYGLGKLLGISFLGRSSTALYAITFANIWAWWGFLCAVFYSAIQGVSKELYEAAMLDGANSWQTFRYITLPQIAPTVIFMEIMTLIWSAQVFDWVWITTRGGPAGATELLATLLYKKAFQTYQVGEAAVIGVIISFWGLLSIAIMYYLRKRKLEV